MIGELKLARACGATQLIFKDKVAYAMGQMDFRIVLPQEYRGIMGEVALDWFLNAAGTKPTKIESDNVNLLIQEGRFKSTCALLPIGDISDQVKTLRFSQDEEVVEMPEDTRTALLECAEVAEGAVTQSLKYLFLDEGEVVACDNSYLRKRYIDFEQSINLPVDQFPLKTILKYTDHLVFDEFAVKCKMKKAMCLLPFSAPGNGDGNLRQKAKEILKQQGDLIAVSEGGFGSVVKRLAQVVNDEPVRFIFQKGKNLKLSSTSNQEKSLATVSIPEVVCSGDFDGHCHASVFSRWANCPGKVYIGLSGKGLMIENERGVDVSTLCKTGG